MSVCKIELFEDDSPDFPSPPPLGSIMIISHINAQTENGIDWLNNIVVPGLRNGAGLQKWSVEVHGGDIPESQDDDDEDKSIVLGPAVYIIHKEGIVKRDSMTDDTDPPTISLRFYSY